MNKKHTAMKSILMAGAILLAGCQKAPGQDRAPTKPIDDVAALGEFLPAGAELLTPQKGRKNRAFTWKTLTAMGTRKQG